MDVTELEYVDGLRIMYQDAFTSKKELTDTGCPSQLFVSFNRSAMDFSVFFSRSTKEISDDSELFRLAREAFVEVS